MKNAAEEMMSMKDLRLALIDKHSLIPIIEEKTKLKILAFINDIEHFPSHKRWRKLKEFLQQPAWFG